MDYLKKLQELRIKNKYTTVELSRKLGLDPMAYGLYESNANHMEVDLLVKLCKLYDVTPNYVLGFDS